MGATTTKQSTMTDQATREKLRKIVFDLTYPKGWELRSDIGPFCSIGRVMQALYGLGLELDSNGEIINRASGKPIEVATWEFTDDNGREMSADEQDIREITKLLKLLTNE